MDGQPFYRRRDVRIAMGLFAATIAYLLLYKRIPADTILWALVDLGAGVVAFGAGLLLVSQFVLPVTRWPDRRKAFQHLLLYLSGLHGPVIFVENGRPVASRTEGDNPRHGPGVVLVDSVSGVVLASDTAFSRAVGRGVVFTRADEHIVDTVDLRKQSRTLTPPKDPDPAEPGAPREFPTQAITRDGIAVSANITVTFQLIPGHRPSPAGNGMAEPPAFNRDSVFKAVYGKAVSERYNVPWDRLPALIAVDVWRELLLSQDLDSLFEPDRPGTTPLQQLQARVTARLNPPAGSPPTRESIVLAGRGIQVFNVSISGLSLPASVMEKRVEFWKETWQDRAERDAAEREPRIREIRRAGHVDGHTDTAETLTSDLRLALGRGETPSSRAALLMILEGALQLCRRPALFRDAKVLQQLYEWAQNLDERGNPQVPLT